MKSIENMLFFSIHDHINIKVMHISKFHQNVLLPYMLTTFHVNFKEIDQRDRELLAKNEEKVAF